MSTFHRPPFTTILPYTPPPEDPVPQPVTLEWENIATVQQLEALKAKVNDRDMEYMKALETLRRGHVDAHTGYGEQMLVLESSIENVARHVGKQILRLDERHDVFHGAHTHTRYWLAVVSIVAVGSLVLNLFTVLK